MQICPGSVQNSIYLIKDLILFFVKKKVAQLHSRPLLHFLLWRCSVCCNRCNYCWLATACATSAATAAVNTWTAATSLRTKMGKR